MKGNVQQGHTGLQGACHEKSSQASLGRDQNLRDDEGTHTELCSGVSIAQE